MPPVLPSGVLPSDIFCFEKTPPVISITWYNFFMRIKVISSTQTSHNGKFLKRPYIAKFFGLRFIGIKFGLFPFKIRNHRNDFRKCLAIYGGLFSLFCIYK